jgi:cytochrome P450
MEGMIQAKREAIDSGAADATTIDLIGQLIKGQNVDMDGKSHLSKLSDSEVMGNLFAFIVAGHETSANSIHFSLIHLAMQPYVQRKVQMDLEKVFRGRSMSEWEYESDFPKLLNGCLGTVMSETLRLQSPVLTIPKVVSPSAQSLIIDGRTVTLPPETVIRLSIPSTHRNPKYWPHGPPADPHNPVFGLDNLDNDLEEFKPDRWLKFPDGIEKCEASIASSPEAGLCNTALCSDIASNNSFLWTPVKGSYLPFSDGQRSCLGRRFAQVEVMAALAVILSQYSVELAVDEWADDDEVADMNVEQRRSLWGKAHEKAQGKMQNNMICIITVQLNNTSIPLRFVEKGRERFFDE